MPIAAGPWHGWLRGCVRIGGRLAATNHRCGGVEVGDGTAVGMGVDGRCGGGHKWATGWRVARQLAVVTPAACVGKRSLWAADVR